MLERLALVVVVLSVALGVSAAGQEAKRSVVTGANVAAGERENGPKAVWGRVQLGSYVNVLKPPETRCVGGQPTGLPFPPCTPETERIFVRSEVQEWGLVDGANARLVEWLGRSVIFGVNCNFNVAARGPCWGTFEWDVPDKDGVWVGIMTAPVMDLVTYESKMSMVGRGVGGVIDGMRFTFDGASAPGDWYISGVIRILPAEGRER